MMESCKHGTPYRYECGDCLDDLHRPTPRVPEANGVSPFDDPRPAHKLNGDQSVAVSTDVFWNTDMTTCPRGVKVQLDTKGGCALYGTYDGKDPFYVGWAPVPRRRQVLLLPPRTGKSTSFVIPGLVDLAGSEP